MRDAFSLVMLLLCPASSAIACGGNSSSSGALGGAAGALSGGNGGGIAGSPVSGGAAGLDASSDAPVLGDCGGTKPPDMVQLVAPDGTPFCIDMTEVTQADYAAFLAAVPGGAGTEHPNCASVNTSYQPYVDKSPCPDGGAPGCIHDCNETTFAPTTTPDRPVVCVDWCDAFAYCKWAGKRLCGKIGGGTLTYEVGFDDASMSQWFAACSQNGAQVYPYGDAYDPTACEGLDVTLATDAGLAGKKDVGALPCHGSGPYAAVVDLSGGVAELEDACSKSSSGEWFCRTRGGSLESSAAELACASQGGDSLYGLDAFVGFRCCKD